MRLRSRTLYSIALLALSPLVWSCGTETQPDQQRSGASSSDAVVDSASVGVDPAADRIWIVGGYVDNRDAQSRTPIAEATAYDAEGRPIETAPVPVQADRFAFNPGVAFVGEDMFAVGPPRSVRTPEKPLIRES